MFKVAVCVPSDEQEQELPVRKAPTIDRSFEVHRFAFGQLNEVCATDLDETRITKAKRQTLKEFDR